VGANASRQSRVPREQLKEAAQLSRTVQEYLAELEQVNPVSDAEMISATDPDAIVTTKGGGTAMMALLRQLSHRHGESGDPSLMPPKRGSHFRGFRLRRGEVLRMST